MKRRVLFAGAVLGALLSGIALRVSAKSDPVFGQIDSIVQSLSEISGFSEVHPVGYGRMSKRQLRRFLNARIKKTIKPEQIHADEVALKMFGFIPQDYDLRQSTVDLLTEQAAAFYDYDRKRLFLLADSSQSAETVTLSHELSHALADQHFDLGNFMDDTPSNDDENLAHAAVVEGEATWLMMAYTLKQSGKAPEPTPEMLRSVVESSQASMTDYPELKNAPLYIQQSLLFPYTTGTDFFDAVYRRLGKAAFARVFTEPPVDSAQVMHPELYFSHVKAAHPELPQVPGSEDSNELTVGSVGEFDHRMLLRQFVNEGQAASLSPHIVGGQFRILSVGKEKKPLLLYASQWDSDQSAGAFFAFYPRILAGKWKRCDISLRSEKLIAGTGDNGLFVSWVAGATVRSVEGLSDAAEWERLKHPQLQGATLH